MRRRGMNGRAFSQNPRMRGNSYHHHDVDFTLFVAESVSGRCSVVIYRVFGIVRLQC